MDKDKRNILLNALFSRSRVKVSANKDKLIELETRPGVQHTVLVYNASKFAIITFSLSGRMCKLSPRHNIELQHGSQGWESTRAALRCSYSSSSSSSSEDCCCPAGPP